jgi:hypothetical protein
MWASRRNLLALGYRGATARVGFASRPTSSSVAPGIKPAPADERCVGVSYSMWHSDKSWLNGPSRTRPWGTPLLGFYQSGDPDVIRIHAEWIFDANIDFINIDWSNELGVNPALRRGPPQQQALENDTYRLFDVYERLKRRPRISIMLGYHHALDPNSSFSALQAKANQINDNLMTNSRYRPLLQTYLGKPLLIVFLGVHVAPVRPAWDDSRFTVRYMSAYIQQLGPAFHNGLVSTSGYWSWEERGTPTFTMCMGYPEAMTVTASWRPIHSENAPGRDSGNTFLRNWEFARTVGPRFALAGTFNEWWVAEQLSSSISKDLEPSQEFGFQYLDIVKRQSALFKQCL